MLVGEKSKFAIEWKLRLVSDNKKHFYFRLWTQDKIIGDFEDDIMDSIVCGYILKFLKNEEERYSFDFKGMSKNSIYETVYTAFFRDDNKKHDIAEKLSKKQLDLRSVFHLNDIGGTSFDRFNIICCKVSDRQVLIWKDLATNEVNETYLPLGYIEGVMVEFIKKC